MKTVFIGDPHGRDAWKLIVEKQQPDHVVFMGDYFDSFDIGAAEQMHNFKEIVAYKESSPSVHVIMLIGNHDLHYFTGDNGTSGFQRSMYFPIHELVQANKHHMQMAYQYKDFLCTHAGVSPLWLEEYGWDGQESIVRFVNQVWKHRPDRFIFSGFDTYGDDTFQTPVWIRPRSLQLACKDHWIRKEYVQIVGHTQVQTIDIEGKATGGRYYFIDALDSCQYLVHDEENGLTLGTFDREDKPTKTV